MYYGTDTGSDIGGTSKPKPAIVPITWSPQRKKPVHQRLGQVNVPITEKKKKRYKQKRTRPHSHANRKVRLLYMCFGT